jgi:condensin complex subunit 2
MDSVYGDTLKIASGLGQVGKQDGGPEGVGEEGEEGGGEEGDPNNPDQPKKKRRLKKSSTVEKNLKNINVSKYELEFDVDPLFNKTSTQFDGGSGGNQFLATLLVRWVLMVLVVGWI